jgi:hypothetical protein
VLCKKLVKYKLKNEVWFLSGYKMGPTRQFCLVNCQGKLVRVGLVLGSPMALKVGQKR